MLNSGLVTNQVNSDHIHQFFFLKNVLPNKETIFGTEGQLTLFLDYNKERSVGGLKKTKKRNDNSSGERYLNMKDSQTDVKQEARVFIHTLNTFFGFGGGSYSMRSLKKITPTEDFLKLPTTKRGCANDDRQQCLMRRYMTQDFKSAKVN